MKNYVYLLVAALSTLGCVQFSPYEIRLEDDERDLNLKNLVKIFQVPEKDTFCFVFAGDAQRYYDEAFPFVDRVNEEEEVDFVIFAGDFTDFGMAQEFQGMNKIIRNLDVPYLVVLGNHDLVYNGGKVYQQMFGVYDFKFTWHGFRFVFHNTNSREFGFNGNVPNIPLLNESLNDTADYYGAIVVVHVPPGNNDFDNSLEQEFADALSLPGKTMMELNGHNHNHETNYPYHGDVEYITSNSLRNKKYLKFKIWKGDSPQRSYSYENVDF